MCNLACLDFARSLTAQEVTAKAVLDVGSLDVNGSLRALITRLDPSQYIGVDIQPGPSVDAVCDVAVLAERFGDDSQDVVIATELLEHVRDWRTAILNLKRVLRPGGVVLVTTRSRGFAYHGYPHDYWRYEVEDMRKIFADFSISSVKPDPSAPGVFVKATKPEGWKPAELSGITLYSIVARRRVHEVSDRQVALGTAILSVPWRLYTLGRKVLPRPARRLAKRLFYGEDLAS